MSGNKSQKDLSDFLVEFSQEEHQLVEEAVRQYGKYWHHATRCVAVINEMMIRWHSDTILISTLLLFSGQQAALAVLSAVRQHAAQSAMCFRLMLESMMLTTYATSDPRLTADLREALNSPTILEKLLKPRLSNKLMGKVYPWIKRSYPNHSQRIDQLKSKYLNRLYTHPNLATVIASYRSGQGKSGKMYFDAEDNYAVRRSLWIIADGILCTVGLLSQSLTKSASGMITKDTLINLQRLEGDGVILREELKQGRLVAR
ncbi:MAG: hypothetical protein ABIG43_06950 [Chloroflexota bacterium]